MEHPWLEQDWLKRTYGFCFPLIKFQKNLIPGAWKIMRRLLIRTNPVPSFNKGKMVSLQFQRPLLRRVQIRVVIQLNLASFVWMNQSSIFHRRQNSIAGFWQRFWHAVYRIYPIWWKRPFLISLNRSANLLSDRGTSKICTQRMMLQFVWVLTTYLQNGIPSSIEIQRFQTCGE